MQQMFRCAFFWGTKKGYVSEKGHRVPDFLMSLLLADLRKCRSRRTATRPPHRPSRTAENGACRTPGCLSGARSCLRRWGFQQIFEVCSWIIFTGQDESDVFVCAEAIYDMSVCYILDGVLVLFGAILTILFCRLRVRQSVWEVFIAHRKDGFNIFHHPVTFLCLNICLWIRGFIVW